MWTGLALISRLHATEGKSVRLWVWRNLRVELPEDWEMLQFSRNMETGSCAFADRYRFRFELNWRVVEGPPDFDRMMSDYEGKLSNEDGVENCRRVRMRGWHGIEGSSESLSTTRLGRFFPDESCLVEIVFIWPGKRDKRLARRVIESIKTEKEHPDSLRRWRAFGMDMLVGSDKKLHECLVEPANVKMVFRNGNPDLEERFTRMGLVDEWLHKTVGKWLEKRKPEALRDIRMNFENIGGHHVEKIHGRLPARGIRKFLGRKIEWEAAAWICPKDGRLYAATRKDNGSDANGTCLSCCESMNLKA